MATVPEVNILVLGDPDCGKSLFLANLPQAQLPSCSSSAYTAVDALRDVDLPLTYNVTLYNRPYIFRLFAASSPTQLSFPTFQEPDMVILAYDISSRFSLQSLLQNWRHQLQLQSGHLEDRLQIMLLGLKRDLRGSLPETEMVLQQEGHRMAQKMHCDAYAECSAMTGELMWEVLEDITKMSAKTTTKKHAKAYGMTCNTM